MIIVGTHVDHPALSRTVLQQIWHQLRQLLSEARDHHQHYFTHADRLADCLLCQTDPHCRRQSDSTSSTTDPTDVTTDVTTDHSQTASCFINHAFDAGDVTDTVLDSDDYDDDDDDTALTNVLRNHNNNNNNNNNKRTVMLPHVVGYYEVSCTARGQGIAHLRDAVTQLASRLIGNNPDIPRRWLNVDQSLVARAERSGSVCTLDELRDIASVQGVTGSQDVLNMIHFFRAQGRILYFPQVSDSSVYSVRMTSRYHLCFMCLRVVNKNGIYLLKHWD